MSMYCDLKETSEILNNAKKIVLCGHVSPDGDALGSSLALFQALQLLNKDVTITVDDDISTVYSFLPEIEKIKKFNDDEIIEADLLVVIDASSIDRIGNVQKCVVAKKS